MESMLAWVRFELRNHNFTKKFPLAILTRPIILYIKTVKVAIDVQFFMLYSARRAELRYNKLASFTYRAGKEKENMTSAIAVAQTFLDLAKKDGKSLSNMQLQKLVFFAHGVYLAAFDVPLIYEDIKAWSFGPVIPELYEELRKFGRYPVDTELAPHTRTDVLKNGAEILAINAVWKAYKQHSAGQLSKISHLPGTPWDQVWNKNDDRYQTIPAQLIKEYYKNRINRNDPGR